MGGAYSSSLALKPVNDDQKLRPFNYLNQPIKDHPLVIARSRLEVFFEDTLCLAQRL